MATSSRHIGPRRSSAGISAIATKQSTTRAVRLPDPVPQTVLAPSSCPERSATVTIHQAGMPANLPPS